MVTSAPLADSRTVRWRRLDAPGIEECTLERHASEWVLRGWVSTTFGGTGFRVRYLVECGPDWTSRFAQVEATVEGTVRRIRVEAHADGTWTEGTKPLPELKGCEDIDLDISPSTNTLPIRRLKLKIGESAKVDAAWIRFPSCVVERLPQRYTRLADRRYRYESLGSRWIGEFEVDEDGLVIDYPTFRMRD
jgi:uncharacterized protein